MSLVGRVKKINSSGNRGYRTTFWGSKQRNENQVQLGFKRRLTSTDLTLVKQMIKTYGMRIGLCTEKVEVGK